jgi:abortive infection bacteriophage resistance protein
MNQTQEQDEKKFYEVIVENTQRGDLYKLKFKNDNTIYLGIPVICATCEDENEVKFNFKVIEPKGHKDLITEYISEIEYLQRT